MTLYNVHIYREMRLYFPDIEANTPEEAARIAACKPTPEANEIDDCDGENLAALVDVAGDEDYEHSRLIEFESERLRKFAPKLLTALKGCLFALDENLDGSGPSKAQAIAIASAVITEATGSTSSEPRQPIINEALLTAADTLGAAMDGTTGQFDDERAGPDGASRLARSAIATATTGKGADAPEFNVPELLAVRSQIALIWSVEDVQEVRPDLTGEQAWDVLQRVQDKHDATIGVTWETLEWAARGLFGDAPETDQP